MNDHDIHKSWSQISHTHTHTQRLTVSYGVEGPLVVLEEGVTFYFIHSSPAKPHLPEHSKTLVSKPKPRPTTTLTNPLSDVCVCVRLELPTASGWWETAEHGGVEERKRHTQQHPKIRIGHSPPIPCIWIRGVQQFGLPRVGHSCS